MKSKYRYLLGDSKKETQRLKRQAALWDPESHKLFDQLKIRKKTKILEIGPGAGSLYFNLQYRTGVGVDFVERSQTFYLKLHQKLKRKKVTNFQSWNCNLIDADLPDAHYDLIFARWVFLFLPNPEIHIKKITQALKPGGKLVIQDYYRDTLSMIPMPRDWNNFKKADYKFFASQGGNASIATQIPELMKKSGLKINKIEPVLKSGKPKSKTWNWISDYFLGVLKSYSKFRPFSPQQAIRLKREWLKNSLNPESLIIAPMVVNLVATKPKTRN